MHTLTPSNSLPSQDEALLELEKLSVADARLRRLVAACRGEPPTDAGSQALSQVGVPLTTGAMILHLLARRPPEEITLETGFGFGVSACFFALGRKAGDDSTHYCFDPYLEWTGGVGESLLARVGVAGQVSLSKQLSWAGLAELHQRLGSGSVGVALLDGSQWFDQAMADFVIIEQLLKPDGILLIRDPHLLHAAALISFLRTNAGFEVTAWSDQLAVARRVPGADRAWYQYEPFEVPPISRPRPIDGAVEIRAPDGAPFVFLDESHHQYYLRRVLHGQEYPALHPGEYEPTVILDIGAHVGSAARHFARLYPRARIVSVEPTPESFALLERNTRHLPNVERFNLAFAARAGKLAIYRGKLSSGQNSGVPNEENRSEFFEAEAMTPLEFCAARGLANISIIKIDVEGMELQILRNLRPLLRRVDVFYVEYHSELLRREIENLLGLDYSLFAAEASEADRGTACYARTALIEKLRAQGQGTRYVFAKASA